MTRTAIYSLQDNALREQPTMEKPRRPFAANYDNQDGFNLDLQDYQNELYGYNLHLATLRTIPVHESARSLWKDGDRLEENRDYKVVWEGSLTQTATDKPLGFIAFPLPVKSEDDLWREVCMRIFEKHISKRGDMWIDTSAAISYLKKHYTISIKSQE